MIVVDSAAVVDALTLVDGTGELNDCLAREGLHSPTLIDFDVVCALRGLALAGHLSATRAQDALTDFDALRIRRWHADAGLRLRAFTLRHNLSATDAAYVALAEALNCDLVTRDSRLERSTGHSVRVRVL